MEPVVLASITDSLATFATNVVGDLGLPGVFLLMLLESACIPIPSEATMLFAGFNVSDGEYSLFAATAVGVIGNVVGSWIAYAVGYFGRIDILEKHGRKVHIKPSHLEWADNWFQRYGDATVFFARMLPIIWMLRPNWSIQNHGFLTVAASTAPDIERPAAAPCSSALCQLSNRIRRPSRGA